METAPLKSFATWARTALIREVTARIVAVLAPSSKDRVESASAVAALDRDIVAAGGGDTGRDAIADKVAYTWFNRIIALRFMDANGYTGIGIVSPQRGQNVGQPEVLADAKRGSIDPAVVTNKRTIEAITALLDGTRRSDDPQGEAYALLLAEYCRHWNRSMPFMFEREGDYTELLIPANLLADDSVLARAVTVLTDDVCRDVEVIGWLYQFYISERKDEVFAGFKKNKKAGAAEIPAATQLFTPHWIVRYLVENSLGRLWLLNRPTSRLADRMEYYIKPVDAETDFLKASSPEELKVIDPAVGSGHMLTYAFDLLYAIYEEDGYAPADIPGLILQHNLYGTEIDPRAGSLAAFALAMKARGKQRTFFAGGVQPNICVLEPIHFEHHELDYLATLVESVDSSRQDLDAFWNAFDHANTFGSLIQPEQELIEPLKRCLETRPASDDDLLVAEARAKATRVLRQADFLAGRYSVVVANPPYMGSGNMDGRLADWVRQYYPDERQDLYGCFVTRAAHLSLRGGRIAIVTGDTWMTIKSFEAFRQGLLKRFALQSLVHMADVSNHPDVFGANTAFVLVGRTTVAPRCTFVRLEPLSSDAKDAQLARAASSTNLPYVYVRGSDFLAIPGAPIAYFVDPHLIGLYRGRLIGDSFDIKAGVGTRNDELFMRFQWEVSASRIGRNHRWVLTDKAGEYRKWYAGFVYVMDWENDGHRIRNYRNPDGSLKSRPQNIQYLFREGVTWGKVGSGATSFRWRPSGVAFNDAAPAIFGLDVFDLLPQLNSEIGTRLVEIKGSTLNVQTGMVADLPIIELSPDAKARLRYASERAVELSKLDWDAQEVSPEFRTSEFAAAAAPHETLAGCYRHLVGERRAHVEETSELEREIECEIRLAAGLDVEGVVGDTASVALLANPSFRFGRRTSTEIETLERHDTVADLVSFSIGCMFGRYSLDEPGLILADQGDTLREYLAKVPDPSFMPDKDNVIPIVDGDWFEDDIVTRFRQFLRVAFGEEHFEENLRFVIESLGVKDLRDYFVKSFYQDHVKRYKKRPIYWLFSSPKSSFSALIYMHRYTPSTVSTVLNEYLREFKSKLEASRQHHVRLAASNGTPREKSAAEKEVDRLRKVLLELDEYEHDVLYPLATQQLAIDLDDGVKANYPKFGDAVKKIPGLEAAE